MGRGKTSAMINYVNAASEEERFLFVTPYLTEVARIQDACTGRGFEEPQEEGGKLNNIKRLLTENKNIVSTHALFGMLDDEAIEIAGEKHYTLIVDEVLASVAPVDITPYDATIITRSYASVDENGLLSWKDEEYRGRLYIYKDVIDSGRVYRYNDAHWVKMMPVRLFTAFKDIFILTYLFEHQIQRGFFDLVGLPYQRKYIAGSSPETYRISDEYEPSPKTDFTHLIHVLDDEKMNRIGDDFNALSKNWYKRHADGWEMERLKNNMSNFFRNIEKSPSRNNLWTTFRKKDDEYDCPDWQKMLSGNGYAKGFIPCNTKGTNKYRDKTALAFMINVFPNTTLKNFLNARGVSLDQNYYALSEMIQWIWRSAIRDGKEINIYIPSSRMRKLLIDWMEACKAGREIA